ncbi:glycosyltransferase [Amphritea balenae]|uniref:Glycosyltransferase n=1 Tax=Amphritea balenae TaxID=452629 RepID=A0A3P1SQD1_9GAMM|nr:glycosyltransferase [Amphritea balenae]RRC99184.1 glycosyltransferase [Amphritea balenae]GGK73248.1 dTDP-rhamnosyl transferase RfbF [Amphritea balenae]
MNNISVIIVTYRCESNFFERIIRPLDDSVLEFVIIANSPLEDLYSLEYVNSNVKFIQNNNNLGIAAAQNIGAENARGEFLLFFDQDSLVKPDLADVLLNDYCAFNGDDRRTRKIGLLSAIDYDERTKAINSKRLRSSRAISDSHIREVSNTLSSSSLISRELFDRLGGNDEWLFIDQVDNDLCHRVRHEGLLVCVDPHVSLIHNLGEGYGTFMGLSFGVSSPFRTYYQVRNLVYLISKDYIEKKIKLLMIRSVVIKFFLIVLVLDDKRDRIKYAFKGLKDGFKRWLL